MKLNQGGMNVHNSIRDSSFEMGVELHLKWVGIIESSFEMRLEGE